MRSYAKRCATIFFLFFGCIAFAGLLFFICIIHAGFAVSECDDDGLCPVPVPSEDVIQQRTALSYIEDAKHTLDAISASRSIIYIAVLHEGELKIIQAKESRGVFRVLEQYSDIPNCVIEELTENGINTHYSVRYGGNRLPVVAVKWGGVTYVPLSDFIMRGEFIIGGEEYVNAVIDAAWGALQEAEVPSIAFPGEVVGSMQSERQKQIAKAIMLNEHMTPSVFRHTDAKMLAEQAFALFGANHQHAFRNSVSSAGASGIMQFMRSTYVIIVPAYYQAGLIPDFEEGTSDHINSVKAAFCLFDYKLSLLPKKVRDAFKENPRSVEDYIAISYNGGEGRALRVIEALGERWNKDFPVRTGKAAHALHSRGDETIWFVLKQRNILHYLDTK
ncbi:MAG: hypothetical protein Q8O83_04755 [bacterium]|nr:hypothetical protein [bacterium]